MEVILLPVNYPLHTSQGWSGKGDVSQVTISVVQLGRLVIGARPPAIMFRCASQSMATVSLLKASFLLMVIFFFMVMI